jgi:hypothetical protein
VSDGFLGSHAFEVQDVHDDRYLLTYGSNRDHVAMADKKLPIELGVVEDTDGVG